MSNTDKQNAPEADHTIRPAQVSLNIGPATSGAGDTPNKSPWQENRFLLIGIGVGLVLLVAVIFVLPNKIPAEVKRASVAEETNPQPVIQGPRESPWQEQQFAKERRETQEILAKLLDKQKQLEAIKVSQWAESDYGEAQALAEQADIDYRQQEFKTAQQGYNNALAKFNALISRSKTLYQESLQRGEQAILDGDDKIAQEAFQLAATLQPTQPAPQKGLQRAAALSKVMAEVKQGKQLQSQGQLEQAKQHYQAALQLDAESVIAREQIANVNEAIRDRDFGQQMSLGYAAINSQQYGKAVQAFEQAAAIKPGATDAKAALTQARNEKTQADIQTYVQTAQQHEQNEAWQQAHENFNKALALDENLVAARVGAIRTEARANVDNTLQSIVESPEKLTTASVHREYTQYLAKAREIPNPGPRLQNQIQALQAALQQAVAPVEIKLLSDNQTEVTVYRVGDLGLFAEKQLTLRPGTYTAVGKRNGYRDVRQEFTVSLDNSQQAITIQCEEKITKG